MSEVWPQTASFKVKNRFNLALSVYFTKFSNQSIITNPNLVFLRILFFRILLRGVLGEEPPPGRSLLRGGHHEGVDEEAEEDEDGGAQDGVEGEAHVHLAMNSYTTIHILLMGDFYENLGLVQLDLLGGRLLPLHHLLYHRAPDISSLQNVRVVNSPGDSWRRS